MKWVQKEYQLQIWSSKQNNLWTQREDIEHIDSNEKNGMKKVCRIYSVNSSLLLHFNRDKNRERESH
jgi:hypothetical protein